MWSSAWAKSCGSWNSCPTSPSASRSFGVTRNGSASRSEPERLPSRRAPPGSRAGRARGSLPRRSPRPHRGAACRRRRPCPHHARGSEASRAGARAPPASTCGPHSLISVYVPPVGSTTAVDVRDSSPILTKSLRIPSRVSSQTIRAPVRPPASPVATTGTSIRFSALAMLMPLPPASVRPGARPVTLAGLEVRHRQRPVEGRIHVTVTISWEDQPPM